VQYEETPSSIPIAPWLLFSLCSGRGWLRRTISKPFSVKPVVSQPFSALSCGEVEGSSVTRRSSRRLQRCRAWTNELERVETGGLSADWVDNIIPSSLRLLAALLPHWYSSRPGVLRMEMFLSVPWKNSLYRSGFLLVMYFRNVPNWLTAATNFSYLVIKLVHWNSYICPEMHVSLNKSKLNEKLLKRQRAWSVTGLAVGFVYLHGPDYVRVY